MAFSLICYVGYALLLADVTFGKELKEIAWEKKGLAESKGEADGEMFEGDILVNKKNKGSTDRNMITGDNYRWPKKSDGLVYVPYQIDNSLGDQARKQIEASIKDYSRYTCIKWVQRSNEPDYITMFRGGGCYSSVGKQGGKQQLSLGDGCQYDKGTPTHEMMHALGFYHEQSRSDRDQYVYIAKENVHPGTLYNFDVCPDTKCTLPKYPYDYSSVMHYEKWAFSMNQEDTIVPRKGSNIKLGQRKGLSKLDVEKLKEMYNCGSKTAEPYNNGGVFPADVPVDGMEECPKYINQCADPNNDYYILNTCEITCKGVKKGDRPYDARGDCAEVKSRCGEQWFKDNCAKTCGEANRG